MPSEPDNKMDDLLKTYAKKRRGEAGAPFEMHPATRKLLQTEAAKLRPKVPERGGSWFSAMLALWPRYALALTVFVVLGIGAWTFFRFEEQPKRMAMADAEPKAPRPEPAAAKPAIITDAKKETEARGFSEMARGERDALQRPASGLRPAEPQVALREEAATQLKAVADESKAKQSVTELAANEALQKNLPASLPALAAPAASSPAPAPVTAPALQPEKPVARNFAIADSKDKGASVETAGAALAGGKVIAFDDAQRQKSQQPAAAGNAPLFRATDANAPAQQTSLAIAPQPAGPAGNERFYSRLGAVAQTGQNATQSRNRFSQVQSNSRNIQPQQAAAAAPVLAEFDFEQTGNRVRVVDADGSVYDGLIIEDIVKADQDSKETARRDAAQTLKLRNASPRQNVFAEGAPADSPALNFRASGTNRTLQQAVTINGFLFATATNLGGQVGQNARGGLQTTQQSANASLPSVQRIQGRVQVGTGAETQLEAVRRGN